MNNLISLNNEGVEFLKWSELNSVGHIPKGVAKEGAGESRIPFAHLANSVPVYLIFKKIIKNSPLKKASVLDIGCGTGRNISYVKDTSDKNKFDFFGIDYSKSCIGFAKEQYKEKDITYVQHDGKKLPFPDNSFEFIVSSHVLEHIYKKDASMYFSEISRILKKDGIAVIGTPNRRLCQDLFAINKEEKRKYRLILPHVHEYYYNEIKQLLEKGKWFSSFSIDQTINKINQKLMADSIEKIKYKNNFLSKIKFNIYVLVREIHWIQDLMAKIGTEYLLKKMKISYGKLIKETYLIKNNEKDIGENFVLIVKK